MRHNTILLPQRSKRKGHICFKLQYFHRRKKLAFNGAPRSINAVGRCRAISDSMQPPLSFAILNIYHSKLHDRWIDEYKNVFRDCSKYDVVIIILFLPKPMHQTSYILDGKQATKYSLLSLATFGTKLRSMSPQ